jgi:hypothetical protein
MRFALLFFVTLPTLLRARNLRLRMRPAPGEGRNAPHPVLVCASRRTNVCCSWHAGFVAAAASGAILKAVGRSSRGGMCCDRVQLNAIR